MLGAGICVRQPLYNLAEKQLMDNAMSSADKPRNNSENGKEEEEREGGGEAGTGGNAHN